ncbi:MAG: hypothetical protein AAGA93_10195 [Actinomycetota bacterium]
MRRGLASLITGLSLIVATMSWAGFTLSRTILDPGRSERLAEQLLDNPQVRDALVVRLADAVEPQIPPEVPVSRSLIESGAATALDDPRVRALVVDGFVRYHRNALEGETEPVVIDAGDLGAASRDALVDVRPELDQFLPAAPAVEVELPTAGFGWLASVKDFVDRFTLLGALVAAAGATLALAVARNRGAVLRRVAFWGYGAAAFWLLIGLGVPRIADVLSPTSGAIASAAVDVFLGAMIGPAIVVAAASTVLLLLGFALPVLGRKRAARVLQPRNPTGAGVAGAGAPVAAPGGLATGGLGATTVCQPARPPGPMPVAPRPLVTRPDQTLVAPGGIPNGSAGPAGTGSNGTGGRPGPAPAPVGPAPTRPAPVRSIPTVTPLTPPASSPHPDPDPGPSTPSPTVVQPWTVTAPLPPSAGLPDGPRTTPIADERPSPASAEPVAAADGDRNNDDSGPPPAWEEGVGYLDEGPRR